MEVSRDVAESMAVLQSLEMDSPTGDALRVAFLYFHPG